MDTERYFRVSEISNPESCYLFKFHNEDEVGFEPTEDSSPSRLFKSRALNRSATHP